MESDTLSTHDVSPLCPNSNLQLTYAKDLNIAERGITENMEDLKGESKSLTEGDASIHSIQSESVSDSQCSDSASSGMPGHIHDPARDTISIRPLAVTYSLTDESISQDSKVEENGNTSIRPVRWWNHKQKQRMINEEHGYNHIQEFRRTLFP